MRRLLVAVCLLMASISSAALAETLKVAGDVTFQAVGKPSFLKVNGEGAKVTGELQKSGDAVTGTITADIAKLTTGMDLRDKHMHEKYLETGKYPTATLELAGAGASGTGKLTVKGVTKPVSYKCDLKPAGAGAEGSCDFQVKLTDYPIGVPEFQGVTVADVVDVKVALKASP